MTIKVALLGALCLAAATSHAQEAMDHSGHADHSPAAAVPAESHGQNHSQPNHTQSDRGMMDHEAMDHGTIDHSNHAMPHPPPNGDPARRGRSPACPDA